jgi:hypothetical protein
LNCCTCYRIFEQAWSHSSSTIAVLCTRYNPEDLVRQLSPNGVTNEITNQVHVGESFCKNYKFRNYSLCNLPLFPCFFLTLTVKHSSQQTCSGDSDTARNLGTVIYQYLAKSVAEKLVYSSFTSSLSGSIILLNTLFKTFPTCMKVGYRHKSTASEIRIILIFTSFFNKFHSERLI